MSSPAKDYGHAHRKLRRQYDVLVQAGGIICWRCGLYIEPGKPWHLGHDDYDRTKYRGPEHAECNIRGANNKPRRKLGLRPAEKHPGLLP